MGVSLARQFAELAVTEPETVNRWLAALPDTMLREIDRQEWWWTCRPEQIPPEGDWFIHMMLSGRGSGKTRSGSEWLVEQIVRHPTDRSGTPTEWLVVAETLSDCREICLEGPSGILRVLDRREIEYHFTRSPKPRVLFRETGVKIHFEGADKPDVGRGHNAAGGWLDEIVKWKEPRRIWTEGIMPSMRADLYGDHPRVFVTTTPKPIDLLIEWLKRDDGSVSVVRGSTFDNADNLSSAVLDELRRRYGNTLIGRQELYGEMLEAITGALFQWEDIDRSRLDVGPVNVMYRVCGVDPSLVGGEGIDGGRAPDEMGVVVASRDVNDHIYIIADESRALSGREAARHVWAVFHQYECDVLVYENNLGKQWMADVLTDAYVEMRGMGLFPDHTNPPMVGIDAKHGKVLRAEPVAMRYQQGRVHHLGRFLELENQMISWDPLDANKHNSPDRLDALVHACRYLMGTERRTARIHRPREMVGTQTMGMNGGYAGSGLYVPR